MFKWAETYGARHCNLSVLTMAGLLILWNLVFVYGTFSWRFFMFQGRLHLLRTTLKAYNFFPGGGGSS